MDNGLGIMVSVAFSITESRHIPISTKRETLYARPKGSKSPNWQKVVKIRPRFFGKHSGFQFENTGNAIFNSRFYDVKVGRNGRE